MKKKAKVVRKTRSAKKVKRVAKKVKKISGLLGKVIHYFDKINVAVLKLTKPLKVGDYVEFRRGDEPGFSQLIESMQINHKPVQKVKAGAEIGLQVAQKIKEGYVMLKAKQPSLLEPLPKKEIIAPAAAAKPAPKKVGYGEVKFLKF